MPNTAGGKIIDELTKLKLATTLQKSYLCLPYEFKNELGWVGGGYFFGMCHTLCCIAFAGNQPAVIWYKYYS